LINEGEEEELIPDAPATPSPVAPKVPDMRPVFTALGLAVKVLNARLLLALVLAGGFILWKDTVETPETLKIVASSLYTTGIILPMIWLSAVKG
jgi:hypothetical protein